MFRMLRIPMLALFALGILVNVGATFDSARAVDAVGFHTSRDATSLDAYQVRDCPPPTGCARTLVDGVVSASSAASPGAASRFVQLQDGDRFEVDVRDRARLLPMSRVVLPADAVVPVVFPSPVPKRLSGVRAIRTTPVPALKNLEKSLHWFVVIATLLVAAAMFLRRASWRDATGPAWSALLGFLYLSNLGTFLDVGRWTIDVIHVSPYLLAVPAFVLRYVWLPFGFLMLLAFVRSIRPPGVAPRRPEGPSTPSQWLTRLGTFTSAGSMLLVLVDYLLALSPIRLTIPLVGLVGDGNLPLNTNYVAAATATAGLSTLGALYSATQEAEGELRSRLAPLTTAVFIGGCFAWPGQFSPTFVSGGLEWIQISGVVIMLIGVATTVASTPREGEVKSAPIVAAMLGLCVAAFPVVESILEHGLKPAEGNNSATLSLLFTACSALLPVVLKPFHDALEKRRAAGNADSQQQQMVAAIEELKRKIDLLLSVRDARSDAVDDA